MNLKSSFKAFCEQNKFEVNAQQIEIIDLLDKFLNQVFFIIFLMLSLSNEAPVKSATNTLVLAGLYPYKP